MAVVLPVVAVVAGPQTHARAATVTWTGAAGGTGVWSAPGNWSTGALPTASDAVVFPPPATGQNTVTIDDLPTTPWGSLTFQGTWSVRVWTASAVITVPVTLQGASTRLWVVGGGATLRFDQPIGGSGGMEVAADVIAGGNLQFTGPLNVVAGYTAPSSSQGGRLFLDQVAVTPTVTVGPAPEAVAVLFGTGTLSNLDVEDGGTVFLGSAGIAGFPQASGRLTVAGTMTFGNNGRIGWLPAPTAQVVLDLTGSLVVSGTTRLSGAVNQPMTLTPGTIYTMVRNETGTPFPALPGLPEGTEAPWGSTNPAGGFSFDDQNKVRWTYVAGSGLDVAMVGLAAYDTTTVLTNSGEPQSPGTLTATLTSPSMWWAVCPPTGRMIFTDGTTLLGYVVIPLTCSSQVPPSVVLSLQRPALGPGVHHITATYSTDQNYGPSVGSLALGTPLPLPPPPPPPPPPSPPPPGSPAPGYWLVGSDGGVFPYGAGATGHGSTGATHLNQPIVGMAATPTGQGYWLVAADGGIFPFGDAVGYGSTGGIHLNQPITGMAPTPSGHGYWLVAIDGGIFPFGDAVGYGSTGGIHLNRPIVGMAVTPSGHGYWLVARDGGIFPFGDAVGYGSTGGIHLNQPIVSMAPSATGHGYWLVATDGGIFPFGDALGYGSTGGTPLNRPIVGMATTSTARGYWLVASDGGIFPFGDASGLGSAASSPLSAPIVGIAAAAHS